MTQKPPSNDRASERRRAKRFATRLDVEYRTLTHNPLFGTTSLKDISKNGVSFPTRHSIKKGTSVQLKMNVPGDNLPVFATGTVAWADGFRAGVKLTRIEKNDQARVLEYIYRDWLSSHPGPRKKSAINGKERKTI